MTLALLDSAGLWFRAFHGVPESMTAPDGTPVNAIRGFTDMLARIITDRRPSRLVACLDADWRPAFRVVALPTYKTHRVAAETPGELVAEQVPDTLTPQIPVILEVLAAFGIATAEATGYEADDVIGVLADRETADGVEVVTGDRDLFQFVRDEPTPVRVMYIGRGLTRAEFLGPAELAAKYGLPADNAGRGYADLAVLRGDPSDGLPGVPGVGEKTAAKMINACGTLENLLAAAADPADPRLSPRERARILAAADYLAAAPVVVRAALDAPVTTSGDDHLPTTPANPASVETLAERWGITSSLTRLTKALATR